MEGLYFYRVSYVRSVLFASRLAQRHVIHHAQTSAVFVGLLRRFSTGLTVPIVGKYSGILFVLVLSSAL